MQTILLVLIQAAAAGAPAVGVALAVSHVDHWPALDTLLAAIVRRLLPRL